MRDMAVHFSSATEMWATPQEFFDRLNAEFGFQTDVCAIAENAKCAKFYSPEDDGLAATEVRDASMICETPDCGQVALSTLTTACGIACLCSSCAAQVWGVELQKAVDEVGGALHEVGYAG